MARRTPSRFSLLTVQSIVCGVILLLALLLRLIGGTQWDRLRTALRQQMFKNVVTEWLEEKDEGDIAGEAASELMPPSDASFVSITVPQPLVSPLENGTVTSGFGYRQDPLRGGTGFHSGLDVAAPLGTELHAVYAGTVTTAAYHKSYGYYVVVYSNELEVMYAHCSELLCKEGDTVLVGTRLAKVGSTGDSTGSHVHIELRRDGVCYDPSPLLAEV